MIRVTIELVPYGFENLKKTLHVMTIDNDGMGTPTFGDYNVWLSRRGQQINTVWKRGRVEGFPRKRLGAYDLLYRALRVIVGPRNEKKK